MSAKKWYVAKLKPNAHQIAERNLKRQAFETFLPLQEVTKRQGTRFTTQLRPLFPGYIFVCFNPENDIWRKINSTMGITKLVSFGSRPQSLPEGIITDLMARCDDKGKLQPPESLQKGDDVTVLSGPFADFVAKVISIDEEQRVWLLLDCLGQRTKIQMATDKVKPI